MKNIQFLRLLIIVIFISIPIINFAQSNFKKEEGKFVYISSVGFAKGLNEIVFESRNVQNNIPVISLHQVLAYKFNPYLVLGLGAGYDMWPKTGFIPLYASFLVNFVDNKWSPFWYLNAGYSFKWYVNQKPEPMTRVIHGSKTGVYGESGLGLQLKMNPKFSLLFSVNYKMQQSYINYSVIESDQPDLSQISTNRSAFSLYHFLGFKLGFLF
jgi:hypothetical protein